MSQASHPIDRALLLAAELHRGQVRKGSSTPYVAHLWAVASIVAEEGGSDEEIMAALLHDAAEDQGGQPTLDRIRREFGDTVADIVAACSDTLESPKPPWHARKEAYIAHCEHADPRVLRVSLADKIHNARSILMDVRQRGSAAFDLFKGGKEGTLWYYRSLVDVFRRRMPGPWTEELARTTDQIESLISDDSTHFNPESKI